MVLARTTRTLYASRDGGATWAPVPGLTKVTVAAIDPGQPSTVYAGADGSVWKSTDAATSWQRLSATPGSYGPVAFAFDSRAIYARAYRPDRRELLSSTGARTAESAGTSCPLRYPTPPPSRRAPFPESSISGDGEFLPERRLRSDMDLLQLPGVPVFHPRAPGRRLGRGSTNPCRRLGRWVRQQRWRRDVGAREPRGRRQ